MNTIPPEDDAPVVARRPELWRRQTKVADQILITDVTSNNMTITVRECKTYQGFFKSHPVAPHVRQEVHFRVNGGDESVQQKGPSDMRQRHEFKSHVWMQAHLFNREEILSEKIHTHKAITIYENKDTGH